LNLENPETGDQLLGFGERPIDDRAPGTGKPNARALRAGLQSFRGKKNSCLDEGFVVLPHFGEQLFAREHACLRALVRLDHDHESHLRVSLWTQWDAWPPRPMDRARRGVTSTTNHGTRNRHAGRAFFWG